MGKIVKFLSFRLQPNFLQRCFPIFVAMETAFISLEISQELGARPQNILFYYKTTKT